MSRDAGGFADRGLHFRTRKGEIVPVESPSIERLRCRICHRKGCTVTGLTADEPPRLIGWCSLDHSKQSQGERRVG